MSEALERTGAVMEKLHVYTTVGGNIFAWTDDPELVKEAKEVVSKVPNAEMITFRLSDVPYTDAPGGKPKWELRGWPLMLLDQAREISSRQAVARGYSPIRGLA